MRIYMNTIRHSVQLAGRMGCASAVGPVQRKEANEALHPETRLENPGVSRQIGDAQPRAETQCFVAIRLGDSAPDQPSDEEHGSVDEQRERQEPRERTPVHPQSRTLAWSSDMRHGHQPIGRK